MVYAPPRVNMLRQTKSLSFSVKNTTWEKLMPLQNEMISHYKLMYTLFLI